MHVRLTIFSCSSLFGEGLHEAGAYEVRTMVKSLLLTASRHCRLHGAWPHWQRTEGERN